MNRMELNMGKYFGTDGVRGVANTELTPELAYKLGRIGGYVLAKNDSGDSTVLVGKDTRLSGYMLENALIAGLLSSGIEVMRLGVITTPGVAYLTREMKATAGIMISASHNSYEDNGIKFFSSNGFKLSDEEQDKIEALLESDDTLPRPVGSELGSVSDYLEGGQKYLSYLKSTIDNDFEGLKIALDSAHGSAYSLAPYLFGDLEAETVTIGSSPNGVNINENVGSTHPEKLAEIVQNEGCDFGLAFDGDGDRIIAVDDTGQIVDGDKIMYLLAKAMKDKGTLNHDTVVSTVMSNIGFYKAIEAADLKSTKTQVGDRYVVEEMRKHDFNLGGEQSGHIIMMDYNSTGDGLLTGLHLASIIKESGKPLSKLVKAVETFPQKLVNIQVNDKHNVLNNETIKQVIDDVEMEMAGNGRVLVRASGTEPLVRVMVEAETKSLADNYTERIAEVVKREMGI